MTLLEHVLRKQAFFICENKDADQLCSNCTADLHLCFCICKKYKPSSTYIQNFKLLACFCDCTVVSDMVRNPEDHFSHIAANHFGMTENNSPVKYFDSGNDQNQIFDVSDQGLPMLKPFYHIKS